MNEKRENTLKRRVRYGSMQREMYMVGASYVGNI